MKYKLCVLGLGVMGQAITSRILSQGLLKSDEICAFDLNADKVKSFEYNVVEAHSVKDAVASAERVLFAVKPQNFSELVNGIDFSGVNTLISIMAGVKIDTVREKTAFGGAVVRVMPNMPCMLGKGVCGVAFNNVADAEKELIGNWLSACGGVVTIEEDMFDAVTGVSGSGPAYVYMFAQGMIKGGMNGGLSYEQSKELALDTLIGAAELAKRSNEPLDVLVDRVCSKGGTTIEAVEVYKKNNLVEIIADGVDACTAKSAVLSKRV